MGSKSGDVERFEVGEGTRGIALAQKRLAEEGSRFLKNNHGLMFSTVVFVLVKKLELCCEG